MDGTQQTTAMLHQLKSLGVRISVDDFGTGYSSLRYLGRFSFDTLKIDRSFLHHVTTDHGSSVIVSGIITIACGLGMRVVAEGVETTAQLDFLRDHGCHAAQGYLYARPLETDDLHRFLKKSAEFLPRAVAIAT